MAESIEKNFERDQKSCLLSLDFDEISEIFVEEETIDKFVQDATKKVFCNNWFKLASHKSS